MVVSSRGQGLPVRSMKRLLMSLFTASLLLTGCSSLPESGINVPFDGCTSQSKPLSDGLEAKKETADMKGEVVVLHACLPRPREQSDKERLLRFALCNSSRLFLAKEGIFIADGGCLGTVRFLVKEVLLGSYDGTELIGMHGEFVALQKNPGEYVLFFKKLECVKKSIVKIGACDSGYVDAREQDPNDPAHICVEKVCKPYYEYIEASTSEVFRDTSGIPFIVNPRPKWGLQVETFEIKGHGWDGPQVPKGIRLDALRKCLEAGKCVP